MKSSHNINCHGNKYECNCLRQSNRLEYYNIITASDAFTLMEKAVYFKTVHALQYLSTKNLLK